MNLRRERSILASKGLRAVGKASAAGRALSAWRDELLADLGGESGLSAQRRELVEQAVRVKAQLALVDGYLFQMHSLVHKQKKTVYPIVKDRQQLCDSLTRILTQLGLDSVPLPVKPADSEQLARAKKQIQDLMEEPDVQQTDGPTEGTED